MTLPGPGDPETWGPSTGHSNDPRAEDIYGDCKVCGVETSYTYEVIEDADEDGYYSTIEFLCEEHA